MILLCILQFEEQKDHVSEEQVMRVVFLDPESPNPVSLSSSSGYCHHHLELIGIILLLLKIRNITDL